MTLEWDEANKMKRVTILTLAVLLTGCVGTQNPKVLTNDISRLTEFKP